MIIRLHGEEDAVGLISKQYQNNGQRMIDGVLAARNKEKAEMVRGLMEKKKALLATYKNSSKLLSKTSQVLKDNSIVGFEKQWKLKQTGNRDNLLKCREKVEIGM
jgi:hypothetical protein